MSWWRRTEAARAEPRTPDLLDVWGDEEVPVGHARVEALPTPLGRPRAAAAPETGAHTAAAADTGGAGGLVCVRVNCRQEGRATSAARCPACGHGTALLRDYRWPRTG